MKKILWAVIPIITVLIFWEAGSLGGLANPALFPPPSKVLWAFWLMLQDGSLLTDIGDSLGRAIIGLSLGLGAGIALGLATGRIKLFSYAISPMLNILRAFPPVAILPFVILWFGIDNPAKIFSIAFAVFFPVWINTHIGAQRIPKTIIWSAQLLTKSKLKIFYKIILPATLPFIIAGARISIAMAFVMVFVSELAGASSGLGYRISVSNLAYRIDYMLAALFVLGFLSTLVDASFMLLNKKIFPWLKYSHE